MGGDGYREAYWPTKYRDAIFYCEWGKGKVQVFFPKKKGAGFEVTMEDFFVKGKGEGEFRPLDPGSSEEAHARNRRIELKLTEG